MRGQRWFGDYGIIDKYPNGCQDRGFVTMIDTPSARVLACGVFDGNGGENAEKAAEAAANAVVETLREPTELPNSPHQRLRRAFKAAEGQLLSNKDGLWEDSAGSTGLVAYLDARQLQLYLANVGDSRALVFHANEEEALLDYQSTDRENTVSALGMSLRKSGQFGHPPSDEPQIDTMKLAEGSTVVLVSDGVLNAHPSEQDALAAIQRVIRPGPIAAVSGGNGELSLSGKILREAENAAYRKASDNLKRFQRDDMMVVVLRVGHALRRDFHTCEFPSSFRLERPAECCEETMRPQGAVCADCLERLERFPTVRKLTREKPPHVDCQTLWRCVPGCPKLAFPNEMAQHQQTCVRVVEAARVKAKADAAKKAATEVAAAHCVQQTWRRRAAQAAKAKSEAEAKARAEAEAAKKVVAEELAAKAQSAVSSTRLAPTSQHVHLNVPTAVISAAPAVADEEMLEVIVPEGKNPGDVLRVATPSGAEVPSGVLVQIPVPHGATPGTVLTTPAAECKHCQVCFHTKSGLQLHESMRTTLSECTWEMLGRTHRVPPMACAPKPFTCAKYGLGGHVNEVVHTEGKQKQSQLYKRLKLADLLMRAKQALRSRSKARDSATI